MQLDKKNNPAKSTVNQCILLSVPCGWLMAGQVSLAGRAKSEKKNKSTVWTSSLRRVFAKEENTAGAHPIATSFLSEHSTHVLHENHIFTIKNKQNVVQ